MDFSEFVEKLIDAGWRDATDAAAATYSDPVDAAAAYTDYAAAIDAAYAYPAAARKKSWKAEKESLLNALREIKE